MSFFICQLVNAHRTPLNIRIPSGARVLAQQHLSPKIAPGEEPDELFVVPPFVGEHELFELPIALLPARRATLVDPLATLSQE